MRVEFAFGKTGLPLDLPEGYQYSVLETRSAKPLPDQHAEIERSLCQPIASPPLRQLASGKRTAAISVCDITRPAPNRVILPHVLEHLAAAGIARENVTILVATGLHRPATPEEIREIVGPEIAACCRVENHDARQLARHRFLGRTGRGTPAYIDERFVDAGLRITLGFIEPHFMAGFSGGRKLVVPGLAARETIVVLHSSPFMRAPEAVEGRLEANPLHQELREIARLAGQDFIVDVALTRTREIAGVFAGHPETAHDAGTAFVSGVLLELLDAPMDAAVTSSAGYPLDLTFYQAVKGAHSATHLVKPGGPILVLAACDEGTGSPEFSEMLRTAPAPDRFLDELPAKPVVVDQWQLEKLAMVVRRNPLHFFTPGLPARFHPAIWGEVHPAAPRAVDQTLSRLPKGAHIALVPEGPYVFARVREREPNGDAV